jgi:hypothetical protein
MRRCLLASVLLTIAATQAQDKPWVLPRTPWGTPSFEGVWQHNITDRNGRRVVGLDIANFVEIPYQPWSKERYEFNKSDKGGYYDPEAHCFPAGVPRITAVPYPQQFMHSPKMIAILYEGNVHSYRLIFMDGRSHPKDPNPTWMGHSIGKWDGDTLVVDTIGFNGKTWLDPAGHVHTDRLHVVERFTHVDAKTLRYEFTVDDPGAYTRPWSWSYPLESHPDWDIIEYVCNENNKDLEHMKAGNP